MGNCYKNHWQYVSNRLSNFFLQLDYESATLNIANLLSRIASYILGRYGIVTPFALEEGKVQTTLERGIYYRIAGYRITKRNFSLNSK